MSILFSLIRKVMQACYNKLNITKIDGTESESARGGRKSREKKVKVPINADPRQSPWAQFMLISPDFFCP